MGPSAPHMAVRKYDPPPSHKLVPPPLLNEVYLYNVKMQEGTDPLAALAQAFAGLQTKPASHKTFWMTSSSKTFCFYESLGYD